MDDKRIDILLRENQNIRTELGMLSKTIHNCVFAFVGSFALLAAGWVNFRATTPSINAEQMGILAFCISQIEFFTVMYGILLTSDIISKHVYVGYLEKQINSEMNERLIFGEHKIAERNQTKGAMLFNELVLHCVYLSVFIACMKFSYNLSRCNWYFWLQGFEIFIVAICIIGLLREGSRVEKHISSYVAPMENDRKESK
jgi:hypothetical protein